MKREELIEFIETYIPFGAEVDFIIADQNDNYTAFREQPIINEYNGSYEIVVELPDIFYIERCEDD